MKTVRRVMTQATRQPQLRWLAGLLGAVVLILHVVTIAAVRRWLPGFVFDFEDAWKHFALLSSFALVYRLSWCRPYKLRRGERGAALAWNWLATWPRRLAVPGALLATTIVCGSWGMLCEALQLDLPYRGFSPIELGINGLTPLVIAGLVRLLTGPPRK